MQKGTKVKGVYHKAAYTGEVFESRPHTLNSGILNYIKLDEDIIVHNNPDDPRDMILVYEGGPDAGDNTIEVIQ